MQLALSRKREFLADSTAVELTRNPDGLISALQKISGDPNELETANSATANMYIVNPFRKNSEKGKKKKGKLGQFFEKYPAAKYIIIILLLILIPVVGFFGTQAVLNLGRGNDVKLPNFVNMTREEAERAAEEAGLQLEITEEFNSELEIGKVISQEPQYVEGYLVKENSTVKLVVSKGENIKTVPDVVGKTREEAEEELKAAEFEVEVIEEANDKVEAGYVIRQDPEGDEERNAGETIKIYVSTGIKQITMEHVIGQPEADAKKSLTELGFEVDVVYEEDMSKDDGTVLKQSIDVGETVDEGTEVTLTVNKIAEIKEGTLNINLKSLTGGQIDKDEAGNEINPSVKLKVTVNEDTVVDEYVRKDNENYSITVSGKGTVTIKVFIDGVKKGSDRTLNLNSSNPVLTID